MPQLGPIEFILILIIFMIFFGAGKLPDVFAQAGKGIKAFKDASEGKDADLRNDEEGAAPRHTKQLARDPDELDDEPAEERATTRSDRKR